MCFTVSTRTLPLKTVLFQKFAGTIRCDSNEQFEFKNRINYALKPQTHGICPVTGNTNACELPEFCP